MLYVADRWPALNLLRDWSAGRVVLEYGLLALVGLLALLCVVNSFAGQITPDNSIYLLHARTFTQTLDRFTLSHDSKGIMLCLVLAPGVLIFGAGMVAAAFTQLIFHGLACWCIYQIVRPYAGAVGAATLALLCLSTVHSHVLWGGNARPEDFAWGLTAAAMLAAQRGTPRWLIAGGGLCAACLFMKTTLILAPAAVLAAGCLIPPEGATCDGVPPRFAFWGNLWRRARWVGLGFVLATAAVLAWVGFFDSLGGMLRQCVLWPAEYRQAHPPGDRELRGLALLFGRTHLAALLGLSVAGLAIGWRQGWRRVSLLVLAVLLGELFRISIESSRWHYIMTLVVMPMVIGSSLIFAGRGPARPVSLRIVLPPLLGLLYLLVITAKAEGEAFAYRVIARRPSPYEYLAGRMREAGYRNGETIYIKHNDYQLLLLLNAPRPYPVLPFDYKRVDEQEQAAFRDHHARHPPAWVVKPDANPKSFTRGIKGAVSYSYHVVDPREDSPLPESLAPVLRGDELAPELPRSARYAKVVEATYLQAWRLQ